MASLPLTQAFHIGLCSDTVVTILHPSSTVECSAQTTTAATAAVGPTAFSGTTRISIPVPASRRPTSILSGVATIPTGKALSVCGGPPKVAAIGPYPFSVVVASGSDVYLTESVITPGAVGSVTGLFTVYQ
jgi:hypothetical protein